MNSVLILSTYCKLSGKGRIRLIQVGDGDGDGDGADLFYFRDLKLLYTTTTVVTPSYVLYEFLLGLTRSSSTFQTPVSQLIRRPVSWSSRCYGGPQRFVHRGLVA